MKRIVLCLVASVLLLGLGCGRKKPKITPLQRTKAAALVSEAEFATSIRDLPRAEKLYREAAQLCPDDGSYWLGLGVTCRKAGKSADARKAYERALQTYEDAYDDNPKDASLLMRQMYVDALLGRIDDAKAVLKRARKEHPTNAQVANFDDANLTRMLADPTFKAMAP